MNGLTRRHFLSLAATALGSALFGRLATGAPGDQGIGGTGFSLRSADEDGDRGIGGTGVIGTIRKFGSIIVNDLRIAYPKDVPVFIDGRPASAADLKLGHVVRVVAVRDGAGLSTREIAVSSEVVGRVDRVFAATLTVLGQTVSTADLKGPRSWAVGDHVAVSGLRRTDGTIVASLIEPRDGTQTKVAGPVVLGGDGRPRIGNLALSGLDGALIGERAIVEGTGRGAVLAVSRGTAETSLIPADVRRLSIESYVERRGGDLRLGSGLKVGGSSTLALPAGRSVRAVLTATRGGDGRLDVRSLRAGGRDYRATPSGKRGSGGLDGTGSGGRGHEPGAAPNGPGTRRPMDFGHGPGGPDSGDPRTPGGFFGQPGGLNPGAGQNTGAPPGLFGPRTGGPGGGGFGGGRR